MSQSEIFRQTGLLVSSCDVYYTDTANKLYIHIYILYIYTYVYIYIYIHMCTEYCTHMEMYVEKLLTMG